MGDFEGDAVGDDVVVFVTGTIEGLSVGDNFGYAVGCWLGSFAGTKLFILFDNLASTIE